VEEQGKQVFISFASQDEALARGVCDYLEENGVQCWFSPHLTGGTNYVEAIGLAVRACRVMVLVFTANANGAQFVHSELEMAKKRRKPIIPYRMDKGLEPGPGIELCIAGNHYVEGSEKDGLYSLLCAVKSALDEAVPPKPEQTLPAPGPKPRRRWLQAVLWVLAGVGVLLTGLLLYFNLFDPDPDPGPDPTSQATTTASPAQLDEEVEQAVRLAIEAQQKAHAAQAKAREAEEQAKSVDTPDFEGGYGVSDNTNHYAGQWKDRKSHGFGYLYWVESKNEYYGEFSLGVRIGYGVMNYGKGDSYAGAWDRTCNGYGVYTWEDGAFYKGHFVESKRDGYGAMYDKDGKLNKQGYWKDNTFVGASPEGGAVTTTAKPATTEKQVSELERKADEAARKAREAEKKANDAKAIAAQAKIVAENIGEPNRQDGYAVYNWPDGAVYAGQWRDNKYEGHAWLIYKDGSFYMGEFSDHKEHGCGVYEDDAALYAGEYEKGRRTGYAVCYYDKTGVTYAGQFADGNPNGYGILYDKNGNVSSKGLWENSKIIEKVE